MDLTTILDAYCAERQAHDTEERNAINKFRMSDAGKCRLMRYWKRQGKPAAATMPPDVLRQMQAGIILHDWFARMLMHRKEITDYRFEVEVEDEHRIGHFDLLMNIGDHTILYDLKTVKGKEAAYLEKYGKGAKRQHQYQLVSYASLLTPRPDELRGAYIDRETLRIVQECPVDFEQMAGTVAFDWTVLIDAWNAQEEPDANPDDTWECKFCAYRYDCPHSAEATIV